MSMWERADDVLSGTTYKAEIRGHHLEVAMCTGGSSTERYPWSWWVDDEGGGEVAQGSAATSDEAMSEAEAETP